MTNFRSTLSHDSRTRDGQTSYHQQKSIFFCFDPGGGDK